MYRRDFWRLIGTIKYDVILEDLGNKNSKIRNGIEKLIKMGKFDKKYNKS
jgi:hypothetical protein